MNLYEFTFIAQQGLLQQEVEEMVQELAVSLKNIKADIMFQQIRDILKKGNDKLTKQELEVRAEDIKESLVAYSDFLEDLTKILWVELEEDLSNLKEVKSKIDKEQKKTKKTRKTREQSTSRHTTSVVTRLYDYVKFYLLLLSSI